MAIVGVVDPGCNHIPAFQIDDRVYGSDRNQAVDVQSDVIRVGIVEVEILFGVEFDGDEPVLG